MGGGSYSGGRGMPPTPGTVGDAPWRRMRASENRAASVVDGQGQDGHRAGVGPASRRSVLAEIGRGIAWRALALTLAGLVVAAGPPHEAAPGAGRTDIGGVRVEVRAPPESPLEVRLPGGARPDPAAPAGNRGVRHDGTPAAASGSPGEAGAGLVARFERLWVGRGRDLVDGVVWRLADGLEAWRTRSWAFVAVLGLLALLSLLAPRQGLLFGIVVGATLLVAEVSRLSVCAPGASPGGTLLGTFVCLAAVWLAAHLCHLVACFGGSGLSGEAADLNPLPSQAVVIGQIKALVGGSSRQGSLVVSLRGAWGSGKSTVVSLLRRELERGPYAVVYFDAWQHQAEPSLEAALYREIARCPGALWPWGWLIRPIFSTLPYSVLRAVKLNFSLGAIGAQVDSGALRPPVIWWRRHLARLVASLGRRRLVVILDEVDRCDPAATQTFLTLVPRFLALPGVIVILPTVREQILFKAFHPFVVRLPDLRAWIEGALYQHLSSRDPSIDRDLGIVLGALGPTAKGRAAGGDAVGLGVPFLKPRAASRALSGVLARGYLSLPAVERERLEYLFEEKLFSATPLHIPPLSADDIETVLLDFDTVRAALFEYGLDEAAIGGMRRWAGEEWRSALRDAGDATATFGSLRHLKGSLTEHLEDFRNRLLVITGSQVTPDGLQIPGEPPIPLICVAHLAVRFALRRVALGRVE